MKMKMKIRNFLTSSHGAGSGYLGLPVGILAWELEICTPNGDKFHLGFHNGAEVEAMCLAVLERFRLI